MQIFIHRGKSKAQDCGCGGDARTNDPPKSEAQRRAMWAAAEGRSTLGISKAVGKEFVGKSHDADPASIASELKRLELNNSAFDAMIARLRSDSSIGQPEWHHIASQFIGWSPAKSTPKAKLLQLITNAQVLNARQSARMPRQN